MILHKAESCPMSKPKFDKGGVASAQDSILSVSIKFVSSRNLELTFYAM